MTSGVDPQPTGAGALAYDVVRTGPLLSARDAAARARALRAWSRADRARLERAVAAASRAWHEAWGVAGPGRLPEAAIRSEPASEAMTRLAAARWHTLGGGASGPWLATRLGSDRPAGAARAPVSPLGAVRRALFGGDARFAELEPSPGRPGSEPTIAAEVAECAWRDFGRRVGASLGDVADGVGAAAAPPRDVFRPWSGALVLTLPWFEDDAALLVSGEQADRLLRRASGTEPDDGASPARPRVPVWQALGQRPAQLRVETQQVEIELGTLAGLRPGDILRTSHALDAALVVRVDDEEGAGAVLWSGFLGRSGRMRAVELLTALPGPGPSPDGAHRRPANAPSST